MHEAVYGDRALSAARYRVYRKARAGEHVAAHENIGLGGLACYGIGYDGAVGLQFDLRALQKLAPYRALAYRKQEVIAGDDDGIVFVILRGEAMVFIINAGAFFEHDSLDAAVFLYDLLGAPAVFELYAVLKGLFDLIL